MSLKLKSTKFTQWIKFYYKSVLINSKNTLELYSTKHNFYTAQ